MSWIPTLLQVAVEYGAATSSAGAATGQATSDGSAWTVLSNVTAAMPVPPWALGGGALLVWMFARGRGSGSTKNSGLLGTATIAAIAGITVYVIARWRGLL